MSVVSVEARSFILALFIRDDGERFLLGDNGYDFIDSQLHFTANAIENDEVQKQGTDGVLVAGQVRRASVQTFDGYIGDATTPKSKIEQMRRDFFAFFAKGHHFRVIYVDCNRSAWQRKGGYLVDAPEAKELWQIHPEYHVGLNFEDVNYYEYDENAEGEEILANVLSVPISSEIEGGLEWDEDGAISVLPYGDSKTATGKSISVSDAVEAPLSDFKLKGETSQQTYTGKNLWGAEEHGSINENTGEDVYNANRWRTVGYVPVESNTAYTLSSNAPSDIWYIFCFYDSGKNFISGVAVYGGSQTQTTPANCKFMRCVICDTASIKTTERQLEKGSTATAYEPYVGGVPAPNPDYPQAVQTVTGENVVKITGKNLWGGFASDFSKTSNGIAFVNKADGTITANGTATGTALSLFSSDAASQNRFIMLSAGNYIISGATDVVRLEVINTSGGVVADTSGTIAGAKAFSISAPTQVAVRAKMGITAVANNVTIKPMLELGSTATPFEPYQGQSYEVNLGKNLFDKDDASEVINAYIDTSAHKIATGNNYRTAFIQCEPNTTYTISKTLSARFIIATTTDLPANNVSVSQDIAKNTDTTYTITTNSTAKFLCVFLYHSSYDTLTPEQILATLQIEKGSTATDYAPYFTPIELCKIGDYQDSIYKSDGKWYVHKEVDHTLYTGNVLGIAANQGSGETTASATGAFFIWVGYAGLMSENLGTLNGGAISGNADANAMTNGTFATRSGTPDRLYFRNTAYIGKTGNEMKAILASNSGGASVWYALATPTDTEITNQTLVAQLEAILSQGYTYAGTNNITTVISAGNEQGELEVGYYKGYQDGGYVWEEGGSGGPTTVVNESISAVYPVWTVYGPAQNPILENTTNNTSIEYVGMVADGQTLVIDMGAQTASLDGLNVLSALTGDFIQLEAGTNILLYSASNDAPASEIGWSEIVG